MKKLGKAYMILCTALVTREVLKDFAKGAKIALDSEAFQEIKAGRMGFKQGLVSMYSSDEFKKAVTVKGKKKP